MNPNKTNLDEYFRRIIRIKARRLTARHGLTVSDQKDIEQDLALHLLARMTAFVPNRSSMKTFANRILDRKVVSMLRHRYACRRDARKQISLDQCLLGNEPGTGIVDLEVQSLESGFDLTTDLEGTLRQLDDQSRILCRLLTRQSVSEAARALGITRAQARTRVAQIRKKFGAAGLDQYLE